jgi:putative oxidoreductase
MFGREDSGMIVFLIDLGNLASAVLRKMTAVSGQLACRRHLAQHATFEIGIMMTALPAAIFSRQRKCIAMKGVTMNRDNGLSGDRTAVDVSLLILRVVVGIIFAAHGAQKLFGAFDGPGLAAIVKMMGPMAYPVAIGEFFGGLGLIFGFLTRFSAASLIVIMLGAIALVHGKNGFFLDKQGFEYNLALIGLLMPILIAGPGRFSIGRCLPLPKAAGASRPVIFLE